MIPVSYTHLDVYKRQISPFDNQGRRQNSFAAVEVVPLVEATDHIDVPDSEIRVDTYCRWV